MLFFDFACFPGEQNSSSQLDPGKGLALLSNHFCSQLQKLATTGGADKTNLLCLRFKGSGEEKESRILYGFGGIIHYGCCVRDS